MNLEDAWPLLFVAIAVLASALYSWKAFQIFGAATPPARSARLHQYWFNFVGAAFGWAALWVLMNRSAHWMTAAAAPGLGDFALAAVAFTGITGHLPYASQGLLLRLTEAAAAFWRKLDPRDNSEGR